MRLLPRAARSARPVARAVGAAAGAIALAVAASAHAAAGGGHHEPSVTLLLLNFVNFGIYAYILYRFAWPPIVGYLKNRRAEVVLALETARRAQAEAQAIQAQYEEKMRSLEADAARARAEILEIAEVEARNLLDQARHAADRVRNDARLVAEQEVTRARRILQEESATLVAKIAGDLIGKQLTAQDESRFVADFVAQAREMADEEARR